MANIATLDLIMKYLPQALPMNTIAGDINSRSVAARKNTPFRKLADDVCRNARSQHDIDSLLLCQAFLSMYQKGLLPASSARLVDKENVDLFEKYYVNMLPKAKIMEMLNIGDDERTLYKKLKRSRELFAISLYYFCLFANM